MWCSQEAQSCAGSLWVVGPGGKLVWELFLGCVAPRGLGGKKTSVSDDDDRMVPASRAQQRLHYGG